MIPHRRPVRARPDRYDAVIVGSGPGGGTMARRLARTGAVNPTLTIVANALRVGDVIAGRL